MESWAGRLPLEREGNRIRLNAWRRAQPSAARRSNDTLPRYPGSPKPESVSGSGSGSGEGQAGSREVDVENQLEGRGGDGTREVDVGTGDVADEDIDRWWQHPPSGHPGTENPGVVGEVGQDTVENVQHGTARDAEEVVPPYAERGGTGHVQPGTTGGC